jgi:hypothetical protein
VRADQAQERLVHQGRRLQRVVAPFAAHRLLGELPQLVVDQRQQPGVALRGLQRVVAEQGQGR